MSTFVEVPGVGEVEFPSGMSRDQITAAVQKLTGAPKPPVPGAGTALTGALAERLMDNALGVPEAVARAGQGAMNLGRGVLGMEPVLRQQGESILGLPSGRDVLSGAQAGVQGILGGGDFSQQFQAAQQQRQQIAEQSPVASATGGFLGDAATIATGRAPMIRGTAPTQLQPGRAPSVGGLFDAPIQKGLETLASTAGRTPQAIGARKAVEDVLRNDTVQELSRAAGRSLEAGLEGAVLSMIQGGDPVETGAIAAGGQLATSGMLAGAQESLNWLESIGLKPKGIKGKAFAAVSAAGVIGGLMQMFKEVTPGGQDRILESQEFGPSKVGFSLLAGATLGMLGKRAKPDGAFRHFPLFADSVATLGRTGLIKAAQQIAEDPTASAAAQRVWESPPAFSFKQLSRFGEAISSDDPVQGINRILSDDEDFREKVSAPDPRLAGVPLKDEDED